LFVVVASVAAGALIPELFLILSSSEDAPVVETFVICFYHTRLGTGRNTCRPFTEAKQPGLETLQHCQSLPRKSASINLDTIPFRGAFGVLTYEWKNSGISLQPIRDLFTWKHYRDKIIPTLLATWAV
jgi:hypothetical protein